MSSSHPKTWQSYNDQVEILLSRGLVISDRALALDYLERIGYYRLSGYWFPFWELTGLCCQLTQEFKKPDKVKAARIRTDRFIEGATFQNAVDLYVFDKKLRMLALDALERIEIAMRVDISHGLGRRDRFAYLRPELFHESFAVDLNKEGLTNHHGWLTKHAALINRSKEEFIAHNKRKYGLPLPIWVACEVWDFGTMSTLFAGMKEEDQDAISAEYGLTNGRVFATWLRSLNYMRNVCAHHSRLWNRNIVDQPKLPPKEQVAFVADFEGNERLRARPYLLFCIAQQLMSVINPSSTWWDRVNKLLADEFPDLSHIGITLDSLGVDANWKDRKWAKAIKNP